MSEEDLDLVVHLGDYIYEYGPGEFDAPGDNSRIHNSHQVFTLFETVAVTPSTERTRICRRLATFPWVVAGDDHEARNDYAGEIPESGRPGSLPGGCLSGLLRAHAPETRLHA